MRRENSCQTVLHGRRQESAFCLTDSDSTRDNWWNLRTKCVRSRWDILAARRTERRAWLHCQTLVDRTCCFCVTTTVELKELRRTSAAQKLMTGGYEGVDIGCLRSPYGSLDGILPPQWSSPTAPDVVGLRVIISYKISLKFFTSYVRLTHLVVGIAVFIDRLPFSNDIYLRVHDKFSLQRDSEFRCAVAVCFSVSVCHKPELGPTKRLSGMSLFRRGAWRLPLTYPCVSL